MSTQSTIQTDRSQLLRRVMLADSVLSVIFGALLIVGAGPIAAFLGISSTVILTIIGVAVVLYAADLWYIATRPTINRLWAIAAISADVAWVVVSWIVLLAGWSMFSTAGFWAIAVVADLVLVIAILKGVGLRRL